MMKTKFIENAKEKVTNFVNTTIKKASPVVQKEVHKIAKQTKPQIINTAIDFVYAMFIIGAAIYSFKPAVNGEEVCPTPVEPHYDGCRDIFIVYNESTTNNYYNKEV